MNKLLGGLAASLLVGAIYIQPAQAQPAPQGSYLNSCTHVGMDRDRLIADCRRVDGSWQRTALDVDRCQGDIANINGRLSCNRGPAVGTARAAGETYATTMATARAAGRSCAKSAGRNALASSILMKGSAAGGVGDHEQPPG